MNVSFSRVSVHLPIHKHVSTYAPMQKTREEQDQRRVDDVEYAYFNLYFCILELKNKYIFGLKCYKYF